MILKVLYCMLGALLLFILLIDFGLSSKSRFRKKVRESKIYDAISNVIFSLALAIATIYLTPEINQGFEHQKMRSEYLLGVLNNIKSDTLNLYIDVQEFIDTKTYNPELERQIKQGILTLRYRAEEVEALVGRDKTLNEFLASLECLSKNLTTDSNHRFICLVKFTNASHDMNAYLAKKTHIVYDDSNETVDINNKEELQDK